MSTEYFQVKSARENCQMQWQDSDGTFTLFISKAEGSNHMSLGVNPSDGSPYKTLWRI